jgi:hypothetical protein
MLHKLHDTYRLLAEHRQRPLVREARARRWGSRRRRLRDLLRAPAARRTRIGVHYA